MWIDTHAHFDAPEFAATRSDDWARARAAGVVAQIVPSVAPLNFATVRDLAHTHDGTAYALGIHPMYVDPLGDDALDALRAMLVACRDDPKLVAMGEIGLDGFIKHTDMNKQIRFYQTQLKLAREFELPVILHVRHAQDTVIKYLRQYSIQSGIAHAFNGSFSQANAYIKQGLKLGFGGMLTFDKARQIRRLATELPLEALVLETDAPDIPPSWAYRDNNYSYYLPRIAQTLCELRGLSELDLAAQLRRNSCAAVPRLASVL
ncbi:MAG: TatD family hydrolase [Formosimonas sp.]